MGVIGVRAIKKIINIFHPIFVISTENNTVKQVIWNNISSKLFHFHKFQNVENDLRSINWIDDITRETAGVGK